MTQGMIKIGPRGPNVGAGAAAAAVTFGIGDSVDMKRLPTFHNSHDAFAVHFGNRDLLLSPKLSDWFLGIKHHSPFRFRRSTRSRTLRKKIMRLLDSKDPRNTKVASQIAYLFSKGAQHSRPWDMAEAMWYQSGALVTGHAHQVPFIDTNIQNEISTTLLANQILASANLKGELQLWNEALTFNRSLYSLIISEISPVDFEDHNSTYVYETPIAFKPAVLRHYPSHRSSSVHMPQMGSHNEWHDLEEEDLAKLVDQDLTTLQAYADARIETPQILARGTNFVVRERIFGPRPSHLDDAFYGLSEDDTSQAADSLKQLRNKLTGNHLINMAAASQFLEKHAIFNLVTGGWTIVRPLVLG